MPCQVPGNAVALAPNIQGGLREMTKVSLEEYTIRDGRHVCNLIGRDRGHDIRTRLGLDELDRANGPITVEVPDYILAATGSFLQGLFAPSLRTLGGPDAFREHYRVHARPTVIERLESTIETLMTDRNAKP